MQTKLLYVTVASMFLASCGTTGGSSSTATEVTSSYVATKGNVLFSAGGNCLRTGVFSEDDTIGACEGEEEVVAEAVPAPVPVAVAPPPPPPPPPVVAKPASVEKVVLNGTAVFSHNSAQLTAQGESELSKLTTRLQSYQSIELLEVIGHTDSQGSAEYNQSLSERRAKAVKSKLEDLFPEVPITATGLGETAPVASNENVEGRRLNRRVEVQVKAIN